MYQEELIAGFILAIAGVVTLGLHYKWIRHKISHAVGWMLFGAGVAIIATVMVSQSL